MFERRASCLSSFFWKIKRSQTRDRGERERKREAKKEREKERERGENQRKKETEDREITMAPTLRSNSRNNSNNSNNNTTKEEKEEEVFKSNHPSKPKREDQTPSETSRKGSDLIEQIQELDSALVSKCLTRIFIALLIDILAFTIILPLFPRIMAEYHAVDGPNESSFYHGILVQVTRFRKWIGGTESRLDIVLFGGMLGSLFSFMQFISSPFIGELFLPLVFCFILCTFSNIGLLSFAYGFI
jgi:hypothetical protein